MNTQQIAPQWLQLLQDQPSLMLAVLVAVVLVGAVLVWSQHHYSRRVAKPAETITPEVNRLVMAQASALKLMAERVAALENYLELVGDKQQLMSQSQRAERAYGDAIDGADSGANSDEIMQRFDLARPEANLVAAIYGVKPARSAAA